MLKYEKWQWLNVNALEESEDLSTFETYEQATTTETQVDYDGTPE